MAEMILGSKGAEAIDPAFVREVFATSQIDTPKQLRGSDKIEKAARDFESILLGHWLEQAQESLASVPGGNDDDEEDPAHFQLQGIGMQSLATAITQRGGIGIAALIEHHLYRQDRADLTSPAMANQKDMNLQNGTSLSGRLPQEKTIDGTNEIRGSADK
jgi:Rod binding domain-containing protein